MSEFEQCAAFWQWVQLHPHALPEAQRLLFHVPNGEKRTPAGAGRLKAIGVRPGVPDYILLVPRAPFAALCIEMKLPDGKVSKEQAVFLKEASMEGNRCYIAYGWQAAAKELIRYLLGEWELERWIKEQKI